MKRRKEYVQLIEDRLGTPQKKQLSTSRISAPGSHLLYKELTGEDPEPIKGRAWHLEQSIEAIGRETRKGYKWNSVNVPQTHLAALWQELQQQSS